MNYESLTKKELIELAKRAEEIIKDSLEIANSNEPSTHVKIGKITGTLEYYLQYRLMEGERERE